MASLITAPGGPVHKAVRPDLLAPKRKHVRKIIVDSWNYSQIDVYKSLEKEPLNKQANVCFKALTLIHKVLQEGSPRFLKRSYNAMSMIRYLQNYWSSTGSDVHYGKLNVEYAYFLRGKITLHHKHPLVLGNLSLDDYKKKIKNQPEAPIHVRQQMICHLLDLQEMSLNVAEAILAFHGRDLHEAKKAALVPLVVESDAVLRITVHHLTALCDRTTDVAQAQEYINRFNKQYPRLRLFFDNASRIPYVTDLVSVPVLPADPPRYQLTGKLSHLVPQSDQKGGNITSLMMGEDERTAQNDQGSSYAQQLARLREQEVQQRQQQQEQQLQQQQLIQQQQLEQQRFAQQQIQQQQQQQQQLAQQQLAQQQQAQQFGSQFPTAPQTSGPVKPVAVPTGWMTFGGPKTAGTATTAQPQQAQQAQVQQAQQAQVATVGDAQQAQQAVVTPPAQPQQAQAGGASAEETRALNDALAAKDAEIAHWKRQYEEAMNVVAQLDMVCQENAQRADDLEQHLQDLMQQIQKEKEERLLRKLDNAVANVQAALKRLNDTEAPTNMSSTPEQILSSYHQLLEYVDKVQDAAIGRDHQALIVATKGVVQAGSQQSEFSKGVAQLTDNPDLSSALSEATTRATMAIQKLLETIRDDPYDSDPIVSECVNVRNTAIELERATINIVEAEKVQGADSDLADEATDELMRAARIIEEAAKSLLEAKKRAEERARNNENKFEMETAGTLVGSAMAITDATSLLVKHATILQKENVEAGRARGSSNVYKKDVAWSEGLISAAKSVAASVSELVNKANGAVSGESANEDLVAASKMVAAATAQLLVSSRVRSDPDSQSQKNLEAASKAVSQATRTLVIACQTVVAPEVVEEDTRVMLSGMSITEVKIREMEQQANILKLEKQLETERMRLASMRKAQYKN